MSTEEESVQEYPVTTPEEFDRIQLVLAHFVGHPKLRDVTEELSQNTETLTDGMAFLKEKGFSLPEDAKVSLTRNSPHTWHICIAADGGGYHCAHITLPDISFG